MIFYEVFWVKDYNDEELLYSPDAANAGRAITSATLKRPVNDGSEFSFQIHKTHPLYDTIEPFYGTIDVYATPNNGLRKKIFCGKIVKVAFDYKSSKTVTCQGGLYWLKWSQYARYMNSYPQAVLDAGLDVEKRDELKDKYFPTRKFQKTSTVQEMVNYILICHNWQMRANTSDNLGQSELESDYRYPGTFKLGVCLARENPYGIDVKNKDETQSEGVYITRDNSSLTTPYDWFKNQLIEKTCCNVLVDEDTNTIDIYGEIVPQVDDVVISSDQNIIDYAKSLDYSSVCTVFLPVGKSVSSHGTMYSKTQTTEDIALDSDTSAYIITTIADSGNEDDVVDQNPVAYVTTYESDLDGISLEPIDEDDLPTEDTKYLKIIDKTNRVLVATDEEFSGGITFYLEPPFIVWAEGVEKYGRIVGTKQWSSATRSQLRVYGPSYFKRLILSAEEVEVSAVDKAYTEKDVTSTISIGRRYLVDSSIHDIHEYIPCMEESIDLLNAANTKYTFKKNRKPFTLLVKDIKKTATEVEYKSFKSPSYIAKKMTSGRLMVFE